MTSSKQWQQPRTGKVRRRLQYSNLFHTSGDHDVTSVVRPDDSSQSSNDKMGLTEINISNMDNILTGITGRSIHSQKRESGDEASAMGSLSQSTNLESSDCPDAVNSITNVVQVDFDADLSHFEKAFKHNETRNLSHVNLEIQHFGQMRAGQVNVSVSLSADGPVSAKDEEQEQRRGRRKRKPKVPFEEDERASRKPQKKLRRIKIMRHLGLAAPHGSPFISNCVVRTAA